MIRNQPGSSFNAYTTSQNLPPLSSPLPSFIPLPNPSFIWGDYDSASLLSSLENAYAELIHWQKNSFKLPFSKAGKGFVQEMSRLSRAQSEGSALEVFL